MQVLLNRSQLGRRLNLDPATLRGRIKRGDFRPVAVDGKGRELFSKPSTKGTHERKK
jgi:hypothetical protein